MILAIDTETTGLDIFHGCRAFMVTMCDGHTNYWWTGKVDPFTREVEWQDNDLHEIQQMINKAEKIIMHNAKFDIRVLQYLDINIKPIWSKIEDTILAAHCICSAAANKKHNELGLKDLAFKYLDYPDDDEIELQEAVRAAREEAKDLGYCIAKGYHEHYPAREGDYHQDYWLCMDKCLKYGLGDVERTWLLWKHFKPIMISESLFECYRNRRDSLEPFFKMEERGMYFYEDKATVHIEQLHKRMEHERQVMRRTAGIKYRLDPNNKTQLADMLHNKLGIKVAFRSPKTKAPQMTKKSMDFYINENLESETSSDNVKECLTALKNYKQYQKDATDLEGFIRWCDDRSRVHSTCWITGTRETRQSFTDPAIQTIKKPLRKFFGPERGYIEVNFDLVNIELRVWAYDSGNPVLIKAFEENKSVHLIIANIVAPLLAQQAPDPEYRKRYSRLLAGDVKGYKEDADGEDSGAYRDIKSADFACIYGATPDKINQTISNTKIKDPPNACALIEAQLPGVIDYGLKQVEAAYKTLEREGVFAVRTMGGYRLMVPPDEPHKASNYKVQGTAGYIMTLAMNRMYRSSIYRDSRSLMNQQVHDSLKVEIPIQPELKDIIELLKLEIELAGAKLIPTCKASYKIQIHESDVGHKLLQGLK